MSLSKSARDLRMVIEKAIKDNKIRKAEYDSIIHQAIEDGNIDQQERALLHEFQNMIDNKSIKLIP